jgi:hypothetical protein
MNAQSVDAFYLESGANQGCPASLSKDQQCKAVSNWKGPYSAPIRQEFKTDKTVATPFLIRMPELNPGKVYCFQFCFDVTKTVTLSSDQAEALADQAVNDAIAGKKKEDVSAGVKKAIVELAGTDNVQSKCGNLDAMAVQKPLTPLYQALNDQAKVVGRFEGEKQNALSNIPINEIKNLGTPQQKEDKAGSDSLNKARELARSLVANIQTPPRDPQGLQNIANSLNNLQLKVNSLGKTEAKTSPELKSIKTSDLQFAASSISSVADRYQPKLDQTQQAIDSSGDAAKSKIADCLETLEVFANGSSLGSAATRGTWYVSADAGYTSVPDLSAVVPYLGVNIYLRPVNKDAPLSRHGDLFHRFAITIGTTLSSLADTRKTRSDLFGSNNILLGGGLRLTESIRLGAGAVFFNGKDPSPLVNTYKVRSSYYLSLSFDWNVVSLLKKAGNTLLPDNPNP